MKIPEISVTGRAPNRLLDLDELESPFFHRTVGEMEELCARESVSYLHPSKKWEYPWALERSTLKQDSRILDAGCGASIFPVYLASRGYRVHATDLWLPGRLDRLHGVVVDYARADILRLPFGDAVFDAVFCISVIEHLPLAAMPTALAELRRVLRLGGRLLLTTDFCESAREEMWYEGPGEPFPVDWNVFDADALTSVVLRAPGWQLAGEVDLKADWPQIRLKMQSFHGYPYTAVGVALDRT